jgi:hypothetical protein
MSINDTLQSVVPQEQQGNNERNFLDIAKDFAIDATQTASNVANSAANAGRSVVDAGKSAGRRVSNVGSVYGNAVPDMAFGTQQYTPEMEACNVNHFSYYIYTTLLILFCGSLTMVIINMSFDITHDLIIFEIVLSSIIILLLFILIYFSSLK